jgi:glutathione S-transferase
LTPNEQAVHTALQRLIDDSLAWILSYNRFVDDDGSRYALPIVLRQVPAMLRWLIARIFRASVYQQQRAQGLALLSLTEQQHIHQRNIDALETLLGSNNYFGGDRPAVIDCAVFSVLDNIVNYPISYFGIREYIDHKPALVAYVNRIRAAYFAQ